MKMMMTPKCDKCGHRLMIGNVNGIPAMIGMQQKDGTVINLCRDCIMDLGRKQKAGNTEEWDAFFEKYQGGTDED